MSHVHALTNRRWPAEASFPDVDDDREATPRFDPPGVPAVLIRVPAVRAPRRPSATAMAVLRGERPARSRPRPRRRLRREFRLAGWVLLTAAPLMLAAALLCGAVAASAGGYDEAQPDIAAVRPPSVRLSVEATEREGAAAVILPGYVLPDDGTGNEEPAHAGG